MRITKKRFSLEGSIPEFCSNYPIENAIIFSFSTELWLLAHPFFLTILRVMAASYCMPGRADVTAITEQRFSPAAKRMGRRFDLPAGGPNTPEKAIREEL
jgi:hypothetical protein